MNKEQMKPKDVRSFSYTSSSKSKGIKRELFFGYDRLKRPVNLKDENDLENIAYDLINHVGLKLWRKESTNPKSKDDTKWEISLAGKDGTSVNFYGVGPYPKSEFEDGVDRWDVLMQLIDSLESRNNEEKEEGKPNENLPS
jgi:hypothetical protein